MSKRQESSAGIQGIACKKKKHGERPRKPGETRSTGGRREKKKRADENHEVSGDYEVQVEKVKGSQWAACRSSLKKKKPQAK